MSSTWSPKWAQDLMDALRGDLGPWWQQRAQEFCRSKEKGTWRAIRLREIPPTDETAAGTMRCAYDGCTATAPDNTLHQVSPQGERPAIWMCTEHATIINSWEHRS